MEYNDYSLVYMVKEDEEVLEYMLKKYEPLFRKLAYSFILRYKNKGLDVQDIIQQCRIIFCYVVDRYNPDNEVLFFTFLLFCLKREIQKYINRNYKHDELNYMDIEEYENLDSFISPYDTYEDYTNYEMQNQIIIFKNDLSYSDARVFELRYNGFSYKDIASLLDIDVKKVDNILIKIRKKLEKHFLFS